MESEPQNVEIPEEKNRSGCLKAGLGASLLAIGMLVIIAVGAYWIVRSLQDTIDRSISPVEQMTGSVGTQVAQVLHPTPTILPDPVTVIRSVRALARLETIQYSVEKVITAETNQGQFGFLFGDRLLLVAHGIVIAGVDLDKLGPDHLEVRDGVLYITLPEPEIFIAALDNEKSYVYDREVGILTKGQVNLETEARQAAELEILKAALEDGVYDQARQNAENYLYRLLRDLGYPEVIFVRPTPTP